MPKEQQHLALPHILVIFAPWSCIIVYTSLRLWRIKLSWACLERSATKAHIRNLNQMRECLSSSPLQKYVIRKTWIICITTHEKFTEQTAAFGHCSSFVFLSICSLVSAEFRRTVTPFWHGGSFDYFCRGEELSSEVKSSGKMTALFFSRVHVVLVESRQKADFVTENGIETGSRDKGMAEVQFQKPLSSSSSLLLQDRTQQPWRQSLELTKGSTWS